MLRTFAIHVTGVIVGANLHLCTRGPPPTIRDRFLQRARGAAAGASLAADEGTGITLRCGMGGKVDTIFTLRQQDCEVLHTEKPRVFCVPQHQPARAKTGVKVIVLSH